MKVKKAVSGGGPVNLRRALASGGRFCSWARAAGSVAGLACTPPKPPAHTHTLYLRTCSLTIEFYRVNGQVMLGVMAAVRFLA